MDAQIVLEPHPSSAAHARRWVKEQLRLLGRDDLVDSAVLATSEVVTNAILHARTRITVRVVGRRGSSRVERVCVSDLSGEPLRAMRDGGEVWSCGRGLRIVSAVTRRWGVDAEHPGKCVWFEPATGQDPAAGGDVSPRAGNGVLASLDLSGLPDVSEPDAAARGVDHVAIVLRGAPVQLLWQARRRFSDIKREMVLLLSDAERDTPQRLVELARTMDPLPAGFIGELDSDGPSTPSERTVAARLSVDDMHDLSIAADLFDEVDAYCRAERLLTLAASPTEAAARRWVLSEIGRQQSGLPPRSWATYRSRH